ncbi:MAG: hypothetical protein WA049_07990 [Ferribacterium limneticum]
MTKKSAVPEAAIRIVKLNTCSTLSGRSTLTYQVGCNAEAEGHIRVTQNSGGGQFNADWIPLAVIEKLLLAHPNDKPMTSRVLLPVFRSKSANSPAFVFAALKAEGLVKVGVEKDSGYLLGDIEAFKQAASALIAAGTDLTVATDTPSEPPKTKRPSKANAK